MKAILEFDMSNLDDQEEFKTMESANNMKRVLWDLQYEVLRPLYKHGVMKNKELTDAQHEVVDHISELFFELMQEYNVSND
jgi:6-pyruvoyl-tetrahydropterin synthase